MSRRRTRRLVFLLFLAALVAGGLQANRTQLWEDRAVYAGARDRLTVHAVHTFIAAAPESIAATVSFLESGHLR